MVKVEKGFDGELIIRNLTKEELDLLPLWVMEGMKKELTPYYGGCRYAKNEEVVREKLCQNQD